MSLEGEKDMSKSEEIKKVLEEIQREIDEKGVSYEERVRFETRNIQYMDTNVKRQDIPSTSLNYYNPIWTGSGIKGKVFGLAKRIIRKMNFFLVSPIIEQQSEYNAWSQKEILSLYCIIEEQKEVINRLQEDINANGEVEE